MAKIERFDTTSGTRPGLSRLGVAHDQGDVHQGVVDAEFVSDPVVLAEVFAVVGGEHDDRVVVLTARFELREERSRYVVEVAERGVVGGGDGLQLFGGVLVYPHRVGEQIAERLIQRELPVDGLLVEERPAGRPRRQAWHMGLPCN